MSTENTRFKDVRKELNLNQTEFAKRLGIKQGSVSDIERAKDGVGVSNSIKLKLQRVFRVNIDYIEKGALPIINENWSTLKEPRNDYNLGELSDDEISFISKALRDNNTWNQLTKREEFTRPFTVRASQWYKWIMEN